MKKFTLSIIALMFVIASPLTNAWAQNSVDELDEKFHLEKTISDRLEQMLKTRLEKKYFDITVEAQIKRKQNASNAPVTFKSKSGHTNAEEAQAWYAKEFNSRPFELESVMITLSLADEVNPKYREDLNTWLQSWVKASFEAKGEALVISRPSDVFVMKEAVPTTSWTKTTWEHVERYQNILGMLLLGLCFAVGHLIRSRFTQQMAVPIMQPVPVHTTQVVPVIAEKATTSVPQLYQSHTHDAETKELIRLLKVKIAWVSPNLKKHINPLMMLWIEKEAESYVKIAAFIEALAEGSSALPEGSRAPMPKLPVDAHAHLPKALSQLQQMSPAATLDLYQEIYADLLAKDLSDHEPRHVGFEFLANLTSFELQSVFDSLTETYQIALLTRLPKAVRTRYTQTADLNKLRQILNKSLTSEDPTDEQLLLELQAWQNKQSSRALAGPDLASKISKLRETWSAISRLEETLWMHQVATVHPEIKEALMQEEYHLCFIGEWPAEKLRKFCLQTKTSELAAAITCLPFISDKILSVCGELTRKEIQIEMQNQAEPKLSARFDRFVNSFDAFVESENVKLPSLSVVKSNAS